MLAASEALIFLATKLFSTVPLALVCVLLGASVDLSDVRLNVHDLGLRVLVCGEWW